MTDDMRIGYACINTELKEQGVTTNRGLVKRTFNERGLSYVSSLIYQNASDLVDILKWNSEHDIRFFRMSSSMFPFIDWYEFEDLPGWETKIVPRLVDAGEVARQTDQRITQHPDHFVKLASKGNQKLIDKSVRTLKQQAKVFDVMGMPRSPFSSLNIHVGGAYGNKKKTALRFIDTVMNDLNESVRSRLTVENDDGPNMFTVKELVGWLGSEIPVVFDSLHHECNPGSLSDEDALDAALSTWPDDVTPVVHHSESRQLFEDPRSRINAHSDYYYTAFPNTRNRDVDIMLESKMKEQALLKYVDEIQ